MVCFKAVKHAVCHGSLKNAQSTGRNWKKITCLQNLIAYLIAGYNGNQHGAQLFCAYIYVDLIRLQ